MSVRERFRGGWVRIGRGLAAIRSRPSRRWSLQLVLVVLGLALAAVHWAGIVVGGALLGVLSDSWRRAVLAGLAFGAVVWLAFAVRLALRGGLGTYLGSSQLLGVSVAMALGLGALGGLARAIVPREKKQ